MQIRKNLNAKETQTIKWYLLKENPNTGCKGKDKNSKHNIFTCK